MIKYWLEKNKNSCYGCRACEQACPHDAIQMIKDEEGFLYPSINEKLCINCSLCEKACPYEKEEAESIGNTYAIQLKEKKALIKSSSGGAFFWMANYVLQKNGFVSGCVYSDILTPIHIVTNEKDEVLKMQGSKYIQSDTKDIYSKIESLLKENRLVLFTGTPCQIAGLKSYLGKNYNNLITMDLICHGVPSSELFLNYINSEKRKGRNIEEINFRDKKMNGWCSQGSIRVNGKKKNISPYNNSYYYYYIANCISRYSCYTCKYSSMKRAGDITIGDCWNMKEFFPNVDTSEGYSVIIINSKNGQRIFEEIKDMLIYYDIDRDFVISNNKNLQEPCEMPEKRKIIFKEIAKFGYNETAEKECKYQFFIPFLRKHIPNKIKNIIRKMKKRSLLEKTSKED